MKATRSRAAARKDNKEAVKPVEDRLFSFALKVLIEKCCVMSE